MDYKYFKLEKISEDKGILLWTICRPPMNALNIDVIEEMGRCLDAIQYDSEVKAIVFTGRSSQVQTSIICTSPMWKSAWSCVTKVRH